MRLIGCDLHASQQSIAMLDRDTVVVVEKTLKHEGEAVHEFYASIPPPVVVGIEATGSMGWFLRLMEELAIECRVGHRWRFGRRSHAGRNTIGVTRRCCCSCWRRIGFRPSGCRRRSFAICGRSSCTAINGSGCGRASRTRCMRSRWRTACGVATRCGIARARRCWRRCRWRRTRRIAAVNSKRCISTWMRMSIDSGSESSRSPMNALEPRYS